MDVGIKLKLTPQITEGDYVKLDLYQEISCGNAGVRGYHHQCRPHHNEAFYKDFRCGEGQPDGCHRRTHAGKG